MNILFPTILVLFFFTSSCNTETVSYIPQEYVGNWFDTEGEGYWKFSFQNDFVIAENNFWDAEEIKRNENKLFLSLTNGTTRKDLHVEYLADSTIKIGNKVFTKNFSNIKRKPQNQQISLKGGEVTIMGYIDNFHQYYDSVDRVQFIAHDFLLNEQKSYFADIDSVSGRFELSLNLNGPQDIYFQYGAKSSLSTLFLHPDDTLLIYIDAGLADSKQKTQFMGKYADVCYDINQMYSPYVAYMPSYVEKRKALGKVPEEYYQYRTELKEKQLEFLEQYCSTNDCSETFKLWFRKNTEVEYYRDLMALGYRGAYRLIGKLKEDYESLFIDDINLNDSLYRISSYYPFFLSRLSQSLIDFNERSNQHKKEFEKIKKLFGLKVNELSKEEIAFVHSIDAYQLEKEIPEFKQKQWWNLINRFDKEVKVIEAQVPIDWLLEEIEKIEDDKLKDLFLCNYFNIWVLKNSNVEVLDYSYERIKDKIKNKEYLIKISNEYNSLKVENEKVQVRYASPTKSLAQKEGFVQSEVDYLKFNGDQLMQSILAEHKERVVLIDFWTTTCGPCLRDFKLMKDIKEKFKGKDLVFVYLCAQSSEKNWQHIIKKYQVDGEHHLLTTKQYYDLQEKLRINAFPTYLLLDKKGSLVRNVPRPTDPPSLVRFLTHYLEN